MMDHNLEESLALGVAMESAENVGKDVIDMDTGGEEVQMEFEQIVEQPMFMDTENEEVIVPDFIDDQFSLQEYSIQEESHSSVPNTIDETPLRAQIKPQPITIKSQPVTISTHPKLISVKLQPKPIMQQSVATKVMPRQVAIAPKPAKMVSNASLTGTGKQILITQKHVANKDTFVKKSLSGVIQTTGGNFVTVAPKLKLITSFASTSQNPHYAQLIKQSDNKQPMKKYIIQDNKDKMTPQSAVITKVVSQPTRVLTMQPKTVPVTINRQQQSPSRTIKLTKVQQICVKSPKNTPANSGVGHSLSKKMVMVTSQQMANAKKQVVTISKDTEGGTVSVHPINVPGKGVQYIQVLSKPPVQKPKPVVVIADGSYKGLGIKNKIIQIGDKVVGGPPPLVYTGGSTSNTAVNSLTGKPQQKLVRIAPLGSKTAHAFLQAKSSRPQSLLAPIPKPEPEPVSMKIEPPERSDVTHEGNDVTREDGDDTRETSDVIQSETSDALSALVADAVGSHKVELEYEDAEETVVEEMTTDHDFAPDFATTDYDNTRLETTHDYEVDYEPGDYARSGYDKLEPGRSTPLIVIPSAFVKRVDGDSQGLLEELPVHVKLDNASDTEMSSDPSSRPRKACNCTKSQCLKLYCDCFASGEFCNNCNCNNCHNNLQHEEHRQKAIRGCLDRNPNAFRPKIGKAKGGIDIIRRHNKGCNCKRSGCLKNYCECFEAKIACSAMCKCVGCRNVEECAPRRHHMTRAATEHTRQPCSFMTHEVIEAVCQCLIAAAKENDSPIEPPQPHDPIRNVIEEFSRCLQDIIGAAHHPEPQSILDEIAG